MEKSVEYLRYKALEHSKGVFEVDSPRKIVSFRLSFTPRRRPVAEWTVLLWSGRGKRCVVLVTWILWVTVQVVLRWFVWRSDGSIVCGSCVQQRFPYIQIGMGGSGQ